MKAVKRYIAARRATAMDRVWAHFGGEIPERLSPGEVALVASKVGAAPRGVPGMLHDLRKHGSPEAAKAWRRGYQAAYRSQD